jgi:TRAP-type C4-dicarboxylate transport system permease small subunit
MKIADAAWFSRFRNSVNSFSSWLERVGLVAMAAMALATFIDVIGSKVFKWPLPGSTEMISVIQVIAIAGGLAFSMIDGRHIRVEFLSEWLPQRGKAALDIFSALMGLGLFAVTGWMTYEHGRSLLGSGTKTFLLGIPLSPFSFWIALCCIPMCLVIIIALVTSIERMLR